MDTDTPPTGKFYALNFSPAPLTDQFAAVYEELLDDHNPRDILVLKRIPCNLDPLADHIQTALGLQVRPNVQSTPQHASHVVEINDPDIDRLAYEQRIELLADVIESTNWEDLVDEATTRIDNVRWPENYQRADVIEFFQTASEQDSFGRDVGQVLLEATRQGGFTPEDDEAERHILIATLACLNDRFHERLDTHGLVERANIIPRGTDALQDDTTYDHVASGFEAILALEFEEYTANDRRYLAHLAQDADLIAIGERNASIQRVKTEPGELNELREDSVIDFETGEPPTLDEPAGTRRSVTGPGRIASFLATNIDLTDTVSGTHLHESTFREQISAVANEIEYLRHDDDDEYSDFAVVVNSLGDRLSEARRHLRAAGLPTQTVGAPALAEDPAVTELYAFVQFLLNRDEDARSWLTARVDDFSPELAEACGSGSPSTTLNRWIVNTDLKERVATGESHIEIQEQFQNIKRVTELAQFIDQTTLMDSDLPTFKHVLERAIRFDAAYTHTIETAPQSHGITVTDIQGVKHESYNTVFLLNVVDQEYPGGERLTPLFPKPWLKNMPEYPAVTAVDEDTIETTYETYTGDRSTSAFDTYYHHRERRKLALGARAATENLYFCTYDSQESGLGRAYNPSRYLNHLQDQEQIGVDALSPESDDRPIQTREKVVEYILDQPWEELEGIVNAAHTGETAEIEDTEEVFGVIQNLLSDDDVDPVFADAVASQFAMARGDVMQSD
ncbi:hypothetical protein [Halolamina sp. C58]|uniref:hypothetical protein n=1 Tax=Halolamina sp. C58 TaxID=3421640 RepID=UPI003EBC9CF2